MTHYSDHIKMRMHHHKLGHHRYRLGGLLGADAQNDTVTAVESACLKSSRISDKQAYVKLCLRKMVSKQVENSFLDIQDPEYNLAWSSVLSASLSSSEYTLLAVSSQLKFRTSPASQRLR